MLNVVNFGGGSYVLYAEVTGGEIEVDPEPYGDNFAKPARLLPLEAKALVAAIDLIGDHLPEGQLQSAREKIVDGARHRPGGRRPADHVGDGRRLRDRARRVAGDHRPAPDRDRLLQGERGPGHDRRAPDRALLPDERPGGLVRPLVRPGARSSRARSGSTGSSRCRCSTRPTSRAPASSRRSTAGRAPAWCPTSRRARVWISPERARWAREDKRVDRRAGRRRGRSSSSLYARRRLAGGRDPQGSRRRRGARARGRARGSARTRPRRWTAPSRSSAALRVRSAAWHFSGDAGDLLADLRGLCARVVAFEQDAERRDVGARALDGDLGPRLRGVRLRGCLLRLGLRPCRSRRRPSPPLRRLPPPLARPPSPWRRRRRCPPARWRGPPAWRRVPRKGRCRASSSSRTSRAVKTARRLDLSFSFTSASYCLRSCSVSSSSFCVDASWT